MDAAVTTAIPTMANITVALSDDRSTAAFDNLYPAIVRCFVIVLFGYMAGRCNLLTGIQAKGVGLYVTYFALPVLLFSNMVKLNFETVNWVFLAGLLVSKAIIFACVTLFSMLLGRPLNIGRAGLFGIFATQSNDFALGYPIIKALYTQTHPEFVQYIYLLAPVSLCILNPIGFTLMEVEKRRSSNAGKKQSWIKMILYVLKGIITNPIVFMTVLGILGNFIFQHKVPVFIDGFLNAVGASFEATALFYLGISMVGKFQSLKGYSLITPVLLVAVKLLLLPLTIREIIQVMKPGHNDSDTVDYTMFGFLYGTFPTAPTVFLYATQYDTAKDLVASGLVIGTFACAPLMFLSAKMVTLPTMQFTQYKALITNTSRDVSILGMICCIWVVVVLVLNRRWRAMPHHLTLCLVIAQFLGSAGMVVTTSFNSSPVWVEYIQFTIFFIGTTSARLWTAILAIGLCLMRCRSLCYLLKCTPWLYIAGFGGPAILAGILFLAAKRCEDNENDPSFQYGTPQLIMSSAVLIVCILATTISLVYQTRNHRQTDYKSLNNQDDSEDNKESFYSKTEATDKYGACGETSDCGDCTVECDVEDLASLRKKKVGRQVSQDTLSSVLDEGTLNERTCLVNKCTTEQRRTCIARLRSYQKNNSALIQLEGMIGAQEDHEFQYTRHVALLLILTVSMFIGLFLCMYRLLNESASGIYIEIEFLDSVFNFGQGFFTFAIFGLDTQLIIMPCIKRWRKFFYGTEAIYLPPYENLDRDIIHTCEQFLRYHANKCKTALAKEKRYRFQIYKDVFTGCELVDWLLELGLARDELDAVSYGQKLLMGRVIKHVCSEHNFYNLPYFYCFVTGQNSSVRTESGYDIEELHDGSINNDPS